MCLMYYFCVKGGYVLLFIVGKISLRVGRSWENVGDGLQDGRKGHLNNKSELNLVIQRKGAESPEIKFSYKPGI
jgi:hypothetical protein